MSSVDLVVDVERAVSGSGAGADRTRERHVVAGRTVYVGVAGAGGHTTRRCALRDWPAELEKVCRPSGGRPSAPSDTHEPDLPWDLLVATGRALVEHRPDLYDELVARARPELRPVLHRLHQQTTGRLRVVGTLPARRRVGWVSWVLLPGGWRALTPYVARADGRPRAMVRLEPRAPEDLAREVARWTAEARR